MRKFEVGDRVQTIDGRYTGLCGTVINYGGDFLGDPNVEFDNGDTWYCRPQNLKLIERS